MALHLDPTLLSASLQSLQVSDPPRQAHGANETDVITEFRPNLKESTVSHNMAGDSAGPRFSSGVSSPYTTISSTGADSPLPDPNGLGWPGVCVLRLPDKQFLLFFTCRRSILIHRFPSKIHPPSIECHPCREARAGTAARRRSSHYPRMFRGGSGPRRSSKNSRTLRKGPHVDDSRVRRAFER